MRSWDSSEGNRALDRVSIWEPICLIYTPVVSNMLGRWIEVQERVTSLPSREGIHVHIPSFIKDVTHARRCTWLSGSLPSSERQQSPSFQIVINAIKSQSIVNECHGVSRQVSGGTTLYYVVREGLVEGLVCKGWEASSHTTSWEKGSPGRENIRCWGGNGCLHVPVIEGRPLWGWGVWCQVKLARRQEATESRTVRAMVGSLGSIPQTLAFSSRGANFKSLQRWLLITLYFLFCPTQ